MHGRPELRVLTVKRAIVNTFSSADDDEMVGDIKRKEEREGSGILKPAARGVSEGLVPDQRWSSGSVITEQLGGVLLRGSSSCKKES